MQCRSAAAAMFAVLLAAPSVASSQVLMQRDVSLRMALTIAETALTSCGVSTSVAVVDRAGRLRVFLQGDGAAPHNLELARRKAYTARTFRRTSADWAARTAPPNDGQRMLADVIPLQGGVPIQVGGDDWRRWAEWRPDGRRAGRSLRESGHRQGRGSTALTSRCPRPAARSRPSRLERCQVGCDVDDVALGQLPHYIRHQRRIRAVAHATLKIHQLPSGVDRRATGQRRRVSKAAEAGPMTRRTLDGLSATGVHEVLSPLDTAPTGT